MKPSLNPTSAASPTPTTAARAATAAPRRTVREPAAPFPKTADAPVAWASALADPTLAELELGTRHSTAARTLLHGLVALLKQSRRKGGLESGSLRGQLHDFAAQLRLYAQLDDDRADEASARVHGHLARASVGDSLLLPSGWTHHAVAIRLRRDTDERWTLTAFNTGEGVSFHPAEIAATGAKQRHHTALAWPGIPTERLLGPCGLVPLLRGLVELTKHKCAEGMCTPKNFYALVHTLCGTEPEPVPGSLQTPQRSGTCALQCLYAALRVHLGDAAAYKRVKTDLLAHLGRAAPKARLAGPQGTARRFAHLAHATARSNLARNLDKQLERAALDAPLPAHRRGLEEDLPRAQRRAAPLRKEAVAEPAPRNDEPLTPRPPWPAHAEVALPVHHGLAYDPHAADPPRETHRALRSLAAAVNERIEALHDADAAFSLLQAGLAGLPDPCAPTGEVYDSVDLPLDARQPALALHQACLHCLEQGAGAADGTGASLALLRASALLERLAAREARAHAPHDYRHLLEWPLGGWPPMHALQERPADVDCPAHLQRWLTQQGSRSSPLFDYPNGYGVLTAASPENILLRHFFCGHAYSGLVPEYVAEAIWPQNSPSWTPGAEAFRAMRWCRVALYISANRRPPARDAWWVRAHPNQHGELVFGFSAGRGEPRVTTAAFADSRRQRAVHPAPGQEENASILPMAAPEHALPLPELNRLRLLRCEAVSATHLRATVAHYSTQVRALQQADAQLELLMACRLTEPGLPETTRQPLAALLERLLALAADDLPTLLFVAEVCQHLHEQLPSEAMPLQAVLQHAQAALQAAGARAPTAGARALAALGEVACGLTDRPSLGTLILAQAAEDPPRASAARRFGTAVARAQATAHRAAAMSKGGAPPFDIAAARAAFAQLGWPWPEGPWAVQFPHAQCGHLSIDMTSGSVRLRGLPCSLDISKSVRAHAGFRALVADQPLVPGQHRLQWANGVYATVDRHGVRFAREFTVAGVTAAYEWRLPGTSVAGDNHPARLFPDALGGGQQVWQALPRNAPHRALVTDARLEPLAALLPQQSGIACVPVARPPRILCLRGPNRGRLLGTGGPRTPGLTPPQTLVWCNRRGQPRGVEVPRFGLAFTHRADGTWVWRDKPQYRMAAKQPRFFARARVPCLTLSREGEPQPCAVLVPRLVLVAEPHVHPLHAVTRGHLSLADAPTSSGSQPALMTLELRPAVAPPMRALRALRDEWAGGAAWRLHATRFADAVCLASYYAADKDYANAVECLRDAVPRPADLFVESLGEDLQAFRVPRSGSAFCDTTAHGHAVAAHALRQLVAGLAGATLPDSLYWLVDRYVSYLDGLHNVEAALQLSADDERAILVGLPAALRPPVLQQRAAVLGLALPREPAASPPRDTAPRSALPAHMLREAAQRQLAFRPRDRGRPKLVTPYAPEAAAAEDMILAATLHLGGARPEQLPERLRAMGLVGGADDLRERLGMAQLQGLSATLRDLLCNLLACPERLAQLPDYLDYSERDALGHAVQKPLPEAWFEDASLPMRPMPAPPPPRQVPAVAQPEARPPAPPLPQSADLAAWTGPAQAPLWQDAALRGVLAPLALPPLPPWAPLADDPVLQEQAAALAAGLQRCQPSAFVLHGLPGPLDATARHRLRQALARARSAALPAAQAAHLEALANGRLATAPARRQLRMEAGVDQAITLAMLVDALAQDDLASLRRCNPALSDDTLAALRRETLAYLVATTRAQHLQRLEALIASSEPEDSLRGKLAAAFAARRGYDPARHPALLAFEYRNDLLLRDDQLAALHTLLRGIDGAGEDPGCVLQLPMGAGKTKVLLPLLAHYSASAQRLPVLVVPPALLAVNHSDLAETSRRTFGQRSLCFDFAREDGLRLPLLASLDDTLALAMRQRHYVITTAAAVQSLELAYRTALNTGDAPRVEALRKLVARLADHGVAFIDEADQALHVRNEVVFGVGGTVPLATTARRSMAQLYTCLLTDPALASLVDLRDDRQSSLTAQAYAEQVLPRLCHAYVEGLQGSEGALVRAALAQNAALPAFLRDAQLPAEQQAAALACVPEAAREALALGRLLLLSVLPSCLQRNSGQHYGLPHADAAHAVAIPYRQGQPKHGSEFGCPYEAACYTLQNAAHQHTRIEAKHIEAVLRPLQALARHQADVDACALEATEAAASWRALLVDTPVAGRPVGTALGQLATRLAAHLASDAARRVRWVAQHALPQVGSFAEQAVSDAFDLAAAFRVRRGFTGTPWNRQTYALDCRTSDDTLAVLRRGLLQNPASRGCVCADEAVESVVHSGCAATAQPRAVRALLDVGAFYRHQDPQGVATAFMAGLRALPGTPISGVLFFDRRGGLQYCGAEALAAAPVPVEGTKPAALRAQGIDMATTAVYLDEARCTGTDLPLPRDAVGLATVSPQTLARDLEQGIMRLRGLGAGQSVVLCASEGAAAAADGSTVGDLYQLAQRNQALQLSRDKMQSLRRQLLGAAGRAAVRRMLRQEPAAACAHFAGRRGLLVHDSGMLPSQRLGATQTAASEPALQAVLDRACAQAADPGERAALQALWPQLRRRAGALPRITHQAAGEGQHVERVAEVAQEQEQEQDTQQQAAANREPRPQVPCDLWARLREPAPREPLGTPLRQAWPDARRDLFDADLAVSEDYRVTHQDEGAQCLPRKRPLFILASARPGPPSFLCISQTEAAHWLQGCSSPGDAAAALFTLQGVCVDAVNLSAEEQAQIEARLPDILGNCRALDYAVTGALVADRVWRNWVAKQPARKALAQPAAKYAAWTAAKSAK